MAIIASIALLGLLAGASGNGPQAAETSVAAPESDVSAFRRLRAEGIAAAGADDLATAAARLAEADARIPNHPGLMLLRARVAAAADQPDEALTQAARYARSGLTFNLAGDRALAALSDHPGYASLNTALAANRAPVGAERLSILATLADAVLVEGVARDGARGRWLVSQVRGRTIVALDDDGAVSLFLAPDPTIGGVLGLAADAGAGVLWAATAPVPPATHGLPADTVAPTSALLKISLADGRVLARYPAPGSGASLGDVALAADGTVHVSDSAGGVLFQLRPGGTALEMLLPGGTLGSPQGIVVTPDGQALIVADYSSGLWRVDRMTGAASRLPAPADASLIGADGLITDGQAVYALQNGVSPQRVLKLTPDATWSRIDAVQVLAANLPALDEPTTGLVENGELVFVSRSQWSDFEGDGALRTQTPAPALIARLRLD